MSCGPKLRLRFVSIRFDPILDKSSLPKMNLASISLKVFQIYKIHKFKSYLRKLQKRLKFEMV